MDELTLTPLKLIDRIAALVPPPRTHRHRYFGVLAPNSPLRASVTAMAMAMVLAAPAQQAAAGVVPQGNAGQTQPDPAPPKRSPVHYLWAVLIARIYEVFPLVCPICGGQMRLIAFITEGAQIRQIMDRTSVSTHKPRAYPRRAGHRFGRTVMRRWARVSKSSWTGIWRRNLHLTARSISASIGEWANRRFRLAAG